MTAIEIMDKFKRDYPGKTILCLPEVNPTEIICEVEPTAHHPERSTAIAAITASAAHYHNASTETYEVLDGELELHVDDKVLALKPGERFTIHPKQIHFARGKFTLVKTTSAPGWTTDDHIVVEEHE